MAVARQIQHTAGRPLWYNREGDARHLNNRIRMAGPAGGAGPAGVCRPPARGESTPPRSGEGLGKRSDTLAPVPVTTYAYDAADRLAAVTRAGVPTAYTWSDRGELLADGVQSYEWDAAGRLTHVTGPENLDVHYTYDGANDRVEMTVNGAATAYVVDPFSPVDSVSQVLRETTGGQTTRNLYGLDLFAQQEGEATTYLGYDALSVRLHLDEDGALAATYRYGPYGEVVGEEPEGYGYTGEQWDNYVELTYLRTRYYQSEVGRFISRDPWSGESWWPITLQRFAYVINNPLRFIDPSGLQPWLDITTGEMSQFGEQTGMGMTETAPDAPISNPHEHIGYRDRPLPVEIEEAIKKQAPRYGLPWQIVAGVVASQWHIDTDLSDTIQDQIFFQVARSQPDIIDKMYWGGYPTIVGYYADMHTKLVHTIPLFTSPWAFPSGKTGIDIGPGYASIHLSTAYAAVHHFRKYYRNSNMELALGSYSPSKMTIGLVASDEFSARYASAILRMLADYRFGGCGYPAPPGFVPKTMDGWTMADAVAMWHGWRYGVMRVSPKAQGFKLEDFQNRRLSLEEVMQRGLGVNPELNMRLSIPFFEHYFIRFD